MVTLQMVDRYPGSYVSLENSICDELPERHPRFFDDMLPAVVPMSPVGAGRARH